MMNDGPRFLMKVSQLYPIPYHKVRFDRAEIWQVPKDIGCYVLSDIHENILYIGQAVSLKNRVATHLGDLTKIRAFWLHYYLLENQYRLNWLERGWSSQYENAMGRLPSMNRVNPPTP